MKPRDLFSGGLTLPDHETRDLHYIGEALPAPSNPAAVLSLGTPASPGGSSVPAREDHIHGLDLADLIDALSTTPIPPTAVDLSNYYTIPEIDALLAGIGGGSTDPNLILALDYVFDEYNSLFGQRWEVDEPVSSVTSIISGTYTTAVEKNGPELTVYEDLYEYQVLVETKLVTNIEVTSNPVEIVLYHKINGVIDTGSRVGFYADVGSYRHLSLCTYSPIFSDVGLGDALVTAHVSIDPIGATTTISAASFSRWYTIGSRSGSRPDWEQAKISFGI